jgi:hypothetical protein
MRREDSVDECTFSQPRLANNYNVELETPLQKFVLDLTGNGVESNVRRRGEFLNSSFSHFCRLGKDAKRMNREVLSTLRVGQKENGASWVVVVCCGLGGWQLAIISRVFGGVCLTLEKSPEKKEIQL